MVLYLGSCALEICMTAVLEVTAERTLGNIRESLPRISGDATYLANMAFRRTSIKESLIDMLTLRRG